MSSAFKVIYGKQQCQGCKYFKEERWPNNSAAAHCMRPGENMGRTVDFNKAGIIIHTLTPVWCGGKATK